ncbi:MAG: cytochrome c biogenesis protein CcsA [Phycisphaerales bacterium]|nr:cytochrome c biogenesis protein CcsA [Phycisphaerales bacterium]
MEMNAQSSHPAGSNPLRAAYHLFSSIRLGIFWMAAILVYGALGSAVPTLRQRFELTEFQYFNHWVFFALIALFCINLIVATVRRIPFNLRNLGVLTVHTGLLLLCGGSVLYFGRKVEGDVWLDAPQIKIYSIDRFRQDPNRALLNQIVAVEGKTWETNAPMLGGRHRVEVVEVKHNGLRTASAVKVKVQAPDKPEETVELTYDGSDRQHGHITQLGDRMAMVLTPATSSDAFYDNTTPAILVQAGRGDPEWIELPQLPFYHERFVENEETRNAPSVVNTAGRSVRSKRNNPLPLIEHWAMPIPLIEPGTALAEDWPIKMEIDGYLPYAELEPRAVPGGNAVQPIAKVKLRHGEFENENWLVALAPNQSMMELQNQTTVELRWIGDETVLDEAWTKRIDGRHNLEIHVKDQDIRQSLDVRQGQTIDVKNTGYRLTVEELRPNWPLMTQGFQGAKTPIALVLVESQERSFQRSVLQRYPALNQDRYPSSHPEQAGQKISDTSNLVDDNLEITYTKATQDHFMIVAGHQFAPTVIHTAPGGKRSIQRLEKGESFSPGDDLEVSLVDFIAQPRFEMRPIVIPERHRRSLMDVGRGKSVVRLHLESTDKSWSHRVWIPFSAYNTLIADGMMPVTVEDVPGLGELRFVYGRATRSLPTTLCLERLHTEFYPGQDQPREWTSYFRYTDPETGRVKRGKAFLNNTYTIGHWTLFQSSAARDHETFTVLGVGNRQGVMTMLVGSMLIGLGMVYAFSVKPILVRRRKQRFADEARQKKEMNAKKQSPVADKASPPPVKEVISRTVVALAVLSAVGASSIARAAEEPSNPASDLAAIQDDIDVEALGTMAILDQAGWRYTTVESWSRKVKGAIYGSKDFYNLDPVVAAMELMINTPAYHDLPVIYVKDKGILKDITKHPIQVSDEQAEKIFKSRRVSYRFLTSPAVTERLQQINADVLKARAMNRLFGAKHHYESLPRKFTIIPNPVGDEETPWSSILNLLNPNDRGKTGLTEEQTQEVLDAFREFRQGWLDRNAEGINASVAKLNEILPTLAAPGIYRSLESREAERSYRRLQLMRRAWFFYIFSFFISIFVMATRYRWVRPVGLFFLIVAIGLHGYDLWLRWGVIGRVPVANMYEAVTSSTWIGALFGLLLELFTRKRVFLLASSLLGFFALSLPELLLPEQVNNNLQTMMPILDDIMLRIHTVLIIASYAVITLAWGVANCYLFVSAIRQRSALAQGTIGAQIGAIICLMMVYFGRFELSWGVSHNIMSLLGEYTDSTVMVTQFLVTFIVAIVGGSFLSMGFFSLLGLGKTATSSDLNTSAFPVQQDVLGEFDFCHRVLLYTAAVSLFVGIVLGAVWADYSWGRPWGWDPKEVFALNTWLVYAIIIHARFVTKQRALWTSVLSVFGFAAMQFNWWVVNFYIVGLHSYA